MQVKEELEKRGCQIRTGCEVNSVSTNEEGVTWFICGILQEFFVVFLHIIHKHALKLGLS